MTLARAVPVPKCRQQAAAMVEAGMSAQAIARAFDLSMDRAVEFGLIAPEIRWPAEDSEPGRKASLPADYFLHGEIVEAVAAELGYTVADLQGPRVLRPIAQARQLAMLMLREITGASYPKIARALGRKDHTTALYGCRQTVERLRSDARMRLAKRRVHARLTAMWRAES